ncbi:hypothetical protein ISG27_12610 [Burkholderia pseudomallei]|nr:hypothetical protein [Burkholderia pseudomallei]MBF3975011.1 hypothetical protein [Burkholderia pseudomallei]
MRHPYMMTNQNRTRRQMNGAAVLAEVPSVEADEAPPVGRKVPVFWTGEEKMIVARAMRKLRTNDPSLTNLEAARLAQNEALPVDRQRVLAQERQITELVALIREIALQESLAQRPKPAPEVVAQAQPEQPGEPAPEPRRGRQTIAETRADQQHMIETQIANPTPSKDRKTLVRWSAEERRKIALKSKRLRAEILGMTRLDAVRKAIESELAPGRRRNITKFEQVDWIEEEWTAIEEVERVERAQIEAREQAAELARQTEESRRAIEAARAEAEAAKAIDPASLPFATLIEAIGVKIAGMLMRSVGEQIQDSIMQRITEALGHIAMPAPLPEGATLHTAPRHRKPRVLVVGLVRQQEDDVTRALGELFNLQYARVEHADNLEVKARGADLVVLMTKFISHKHREVVRRVNEHIVYRNGGVTELKRWLTQWINGEVIPATA